MTKGILGKKVGMTQIFTETGELIPVTVVEATPNVVLQLKTIENDGYEAVQLGFDDKRDVLSNQPAQGHANHHLSGFSPQEHIAQVGKPASLH